jgi:serine/threonine protein kinase
MRRTTTNISHNLVEAGDAKTTWEPRILPSVESEAETTYPTSADPRDRYELLSEIGQGGYGYVCQAYDYLLQIPVAIKIINLEECNPQEIKDVEKEIHILSNTKNIMCPQLTQYFTSFYIENEFWIVMEYVDAGSLLDVMKMFGPLPEIFIPYLMRELLLALKYLHSEKKIHR